FFFLEQSLHFCVPGSPPRHCRCIGVVPCCVPRRFIRKIEVIPNSGNCRRTEVIITRKNNSTDCVSPNDPRLKGLLQSMSLRQRYISHSSSLTILQIRSLYWSVTFHYLVTVNSDCLEKL
uniref:Chemokine interleukin-8-like domain-containing protein n=1 Tax=Salarias fasciatus TaxID=181472 RepID=A0A672FDR7_SALFA